MHVAMTGDGRASAPSARPCSTQAHSRLLTQFYALVTRLATFREDLVGSATGSGHGGLRSHTGTPILAAVCWDIRRLGTPAGGTLRGSRWAPPWSQAGRSGRRRARSWKQRAERCSAGFPPRSEANLRPASLSLLVISQLFLYLPDQR